MQPLPHHNEPSESAFAKRKPEIEMFVKASQNGESEAFGSLYDIFVDVIYRYMHYRVGADEAEDLTELVFLKTWENIHQYEPKFGQFSSWIFRIAHNVAVDYYRSKRSHAELTDDVPDLRRESNTRDRVHQRLDEQALHVALRQLKDHYRQVLVLRYMNDLSNDEIAIIMDRSQAALRILQLRALRSLRRILEKMGFDGIG